MKQFETNRDYAITANGRKFTREGIRVIKVTTSYLTFVRVFSGEVRFYEEERVKVRSSDSGQYARIFGGIISDAVYAADAI